MAPAAAPDLAQRLSCADSSFPKLSHRVALEVIRDLDIPAVDICVFPTYGHVPPEAMLGDPGAAAADVLPLVEAAQLAVADVFLILGFEELAVNHPDADVRAKSLSYFEGALEFARALKSPGVSLLPGVPFEGVDPQSSLVLAAEELQRRAEMAGEAGLALSIEPHLESIVETPELTQELLERAPDVTLALDHSHFVYQGISQDDVDALVPRTRHVHLRQAAKGAMQLPTADGVIDFPRLAQRLGELGYDGYLTIEFQWEEWLNCNNVDCVSETAELRDLLLGVNGNAPAG